MSDDTVSAIIRRMPSIRKRCAEEHAGLQFRGTPIERALNDRLDLLALYDALAAENVTLKKWLQFFEERANAYQDEWQAIVDAWADDNGQFGVGA